MALIKSMVVFKRIPEKNKDQDRIIGFYKDKDCVLFN